jgi:hypothetical protein
MLLHRFLDWLWDDHLRLFQQPYFAGVLRVLECSVKACARWAVQCAHDADTYCFSEEMAGMRDGGKSIGIADMDKLAQVLLK